MSLPSLPKMSARLGLTGAIELAHIRRADYLAEWLLRAIETVFFYHPAIWWMTAMLRRERERCCDDMAIAAGADRAVYARALLELEGLRVPAMATGGSGSDLSGRIRRILGANSSAMPTPAFAMLALAAVLVLSPAIIAQAPDAYQRWVSEDAERQQFVKQFGQRRDPTPGTERNEYKEEHYRRIAYANEKFRGQAPGKPGWQSEKGRTYIIFGPPDEMEVHPKDNMEHWLYHFIEGRGKNVIFTFTVRPPA